jgi:hypothetical protein
MTLALCQAELFTSLFGEREAPGSASSFGATMFERTHVVKAVDANLPYRKTASVGVIIEFYDKNTQRIVMDREIQTYINQGRITRNGSFETHYEHMLAEARKKFPWWTVPEDRVTYFGRNPCAEIPLRALSGITNLRSSIINTLAGSPYPALLTDNQLRHIMRQLWINCYPVHRDYTLVKILTTRVLNKKKAAQLRGLAQSQNVVQLIHSFYNQNRIR